MPGEPAETMIGVVGVGLGALLLYSAVKNKSPIAIIRNAVTTGSLDLVNVPGLVDDNTGQKVGSTIGDTILKASILVAAESIPDTVLKNDVTNYVSNGIGDPAALMQRLVAAGFPAIAKSVGQLATQRGAAQPAASTPPIPGQVTV